MNPYESFGKEEFVEGISKSLDAIKTLKQIMRTLKKAVEADYKELQLTGPQGFMLGTLACNGQMKISDLSEKMALSNSTVSGIVDRLEKQGLVERIRSNEDRRVVIVRATEQFHKCKRDKMTRIEDIIQQQMSAATQEELDKILEGLTILKTILCND